MELGIAILECWEWESTIPSVYNQQSRSLYECSTGCICLLKTAVHSGCCML